MVRTERYSLASRVMIRLCCLLVAFFCIGGCNAFSVTSRKPAGSWRQVGDQWKNGRCSSTRLHFFNFGRKDPEPEAEKEVESPTPAAEEEEQDFAEKLFTMFFGKPEESPMGLKRFGQERFPEQYPAVIDEWADPLEGDDKDVAKLRPLLKNTNLETRGLRLAYSANRNGWNPSAFHNAVDKKGPSLLVATTTSGLVCGGYNPKGWVSYGENRGSIAAFLFVQDDSSPVGWTKLRKVGGPSLAQANDVPEAGPSFGADSLVIPLGKDNPKLARSKLGSYYERFADGTNTLFRTASSAQLKDLKVYQGVYAPDEYVPFTDAEPFALY